MSSPSKPVICEVIRFRAKEGSKESILSSFERFTFLATASAIPGHSQPPLGTTIYKNVAGKPNDGCLLVTWETVDHHDTLASSPDYEKATKVLVVDILPDVGDSLVSFYFPTSNRDDATFETAACERRYTPSFST